jgi:hypothetical protein
MEVNREDEGSPTIRLVTSGVGGDLLIEEGATALRGGVFGRSISTAPVQ